MHPTPHELAAFVRSLDDELLLPALWLIRRTALGALVRNYTPEEQDLAVLGERLLARLPTLHAFVQARLEEQ